MAAMTDRFWRETDLRFRADLNGDSSSWCQIEFGTDRLSFVAKRLLNFDAVAMVDDGSSLDDQDTPPVPQDRSRPQGDVVLQFPADNGDTPSDAGDMGSNPGDMGSNPGDISSDTGGVDSDTGGIDSDTGDIGSDNPSDGQRAIPGEVQTTQPDRGIDCSDPRLFNSRIRNLVCPAELDDEM